MGLSLGMKIDENGNAVPGPTSVMPQVQLAGYHPVDDEGDDDFLLPSNEPENF
jgi:DNA-directed RNA polymerase subunit alpha